MADNGCRKNVVAVMKMVVVVIGVSEVSSAVACLIRGT